jgi:hypothetical protein
MKVKFPAAFSPPDNQLLQSVAAAKNRRKCASGNLRQSEAAGNEFLF